MTRVIKAAPLSAEAFAPYGDVIEASEKTKKISINYGNTTRFHDLMKVDVADEDGEPCVSIFRSTPLTLPITIKLMEYHPFGSQAFIPLGHEPYLLVVANAGDFNANKIKAFIARSDQGVNYHKGTWHHFSLALNHTSDFLVLDRKGEGNNCVEYALPVDEQVIITF